MALGPCLVWICAPAFENKKHTANDRFYGNGLYGGILTKKEPIRTLGFTLPYNNLGYLSADIICSEKPPVFRKRSSRKRGSFEEQIMSKDKYPNRGCCVSYPSNLFFNTRSFWKIGQYSRVFSSFSWGIFGRVTCLDQSRARENIWCWDIFGLKSYNWRIYISVKFLGKIPLLTHSLFFISHNSLFLPPKFYINYFCEMLLGGLHILKSISQQ